MTMADEDDGARPVAQDPRQRRRARGQLHRRRLPDVPRQSRHEAGRHRAPLRRAATTWRSTTSPTWSAWPWAWTRQTLGIDRHFVVEAVGRIMAQNRRFYLLVRREHRPQRRRGAGGGRGRRDCPACVCARRTTSTCAPIPGQIADPREDRRGAARRRRRRLLLAAHAPEDLPQGGRSAQGSIPTWSRWPTSASTARGCITTATQATAKADRPDPHVGGQGAAATARWSRSGSR